MRQFTEYWLRPLDEHGDAVDILFHDHYTEVLMTLREMESDGGMFPYEVERVMRWYADDGDLKDEAYKLLRYRDADGVTMELNNGMWEKVQ